MTSGALSTPKGTALYIGALLGPSLLLLPGLADSIAGPASVLVWMALLAVSGLLAIVFTGLGTRYDGGVIAYVTAAFGTRAGRAVAGCFLAGVVLGAPVVCLIGGGYAANLISGGTGANRSVSVLLAAGLLVVVVALTLGGARASATVQLVLVGVLVALVVVAVAGAAPHARSANWTPFAPHGATALGRAGSALMLAFVGWEAIAPLTGRLRDPRRQLPRVIAAAFAVTSLIYLGLAVTTIAVLGPGAASSVPLADLMRVAVGSAGPAIAAVAAVALTLAATNAYLSGAAAIAAQLRDRRPARRLRSHALQLGIAVAGIVLLGGVESGVVTLAELVALPTTLFLTVYLGCVLAAVRVLSGRTRVAAGIATGAVLAVLAFSGWALAVAALVAGVGWLRGGQSRNHTAVSGGSSPSSSGADDSRISPRGSSDGAAPALRITTNDSPRRNDRQSSGALIQVIASSCNSGVARRSDNAVR